MNVYNLKEIERCFVCGNVDRNIDKFINTVTSHLSKFKKAEHPMEAARKKRLEEARNQPQEVGGGGLFRRAPRANMSFEVKMSKKDYPWNSTYDNSVIIVSGNGGIGLKSKQYYDETFGKLEKVLADNNCYLLFVRGNSDDPSYFENRLIDFDHIKTIPDYSVIVLKTFNCLCVGGSYSIDKEWKLAQEEEFGKKSYWENEAPIMDENQLDEILKEFKISCVITSTSPSFVYPSANSFKNSKWFSSNKENMRNFTNERKIMDKLYEKILDNDSKPFIWAYGRFKMGNTNKVNDIAFLSLQQYQILSVNEIISSMFGVDTSKKLKANDFAFETLIGSFNKFAAKKCREDDPMGGDMGGEDPLAGPEGDMEENEEYDGDDEIVEVGEAPRNPYEIQREELDRMYQELQQAAQQAEVARARNDGDGILGNVGDLGRVYVDNDTAGIGLYTVNAANYIIDNRAI